MSLRTPRTRPALERINLIHEAIRNGQYPDAARLAADHEVDVRTIKRDLEFMRDRLRLPLEFDRARRGYHYARPVDVLPGYPMTEAEIFSLLVAQKAVAQYRGTPYEQPLAAAFQRLTSGLGTNTEYTLDNLQEAISFRPFAPDDVDLDNFRVVTHALQERRELHFRYRKLDHPEIRTRRVHPYHLACVENHWYLFAHDLDRNDIRTFALVRLRDPVVQDARFERSRTFDPDAYLRGSLAIFKGHDDFEIVVEFDSWAADQIRGRRWQASQELTDLPGGGLRLRLRLNNLEEIERWILGWGSHATVLRPLALVHRLHQTARTLADRYDPAPRPAGTPISGSALPTL